MRVFLLISVFSFSLSISYCQKSIDFDHKSIYRTIKKYTNSKKPLFLSIDRLDAGKFSGRFFKIQDDSIMDNEQLFLYVGRVNSCRANGCSASSGELVNDKGGFEYFDYLILYNSDSSVRLVKVFNYQATHGYEISSRGWLKQFRGFKADRSLTVGKNIDGISGATISVYAICLDIEEKTSMIKQYIDENKMELFSINFQNIN